MHAMYTITLFVYKNIYISLSYKHDMSTQQLSDL